MTDEAAAPCCHPAATKSKMKNKLVVEEPTDDDVSICNLHPATMEKLCIFRGDVVLLKGKRRRDTVCIAMADEGCGEHALGINRSVRTNLRVRLGDVVSVHQCPDAKFGAKVHVLL